MPGLPRQLLRLARLAYLHITCIQMFIYPQLLGETRRPWWTSSKLPPQCMVSNIKTICWVYWIHCPKLWLFQCREWFCQNFEIPAFRATLLKPKPCISGFCWVHFLIFRQKSSLANATPSCMSTRPSRSETKRPSSAASSGGDLDCMVLEKRWKVTADHHARYDATYLLKKKWKTNHGFSNHQTMDHNNQMMQYNI